MALHLSPRRLGQVVIAPLDPDVHAEHAAGGVKHRLLEVQADVGGSGRRRQVDAPVDISSQRGLICFLSSESAGRRHM